MKSLTLCLVLGLAIAGAAHGQSWTLQNSGTVNLLNGVSFVDSQTGWVVGDAGTSLATIDGGQTWSPFNLTPQDLQGVAFENDQVGLIVGDNGLIFRTGNRGANWGQVASGTGNNLRTVAFGDGGMAYAAGRDGTILRSTDSGMSWTLVEVGADRYRGSAASGTMNAWLVGDGGVIRATTDGGVSWFNQTPGTGNDLHTVFFVSDTEGWIGGQNDTLIYTNDGGISWTPRDAAILVGIDALFFVSPTQGWAGGGAGVIYATTNGGLTWTTENSNTTAQFNGIFFANPFHGWAVGENGTIIMRDLPAGIGDGVSANGARTIQLRQNYPNPVHSQTTIEYALPREGRVRLSVFDLQGRELTRLVEQVQSAGAHRVDWDGAGQGAGVYFYRLDVDGSSMTRKLLRVTADTE